MLRELKINNKKLKVAVADTDELRYKGLSGLKKLGAYKGMLFIFTEPIRVKMVMRDMNFPLDFIFLDNKWNIIQLNSLSKDDKKGVDAFKPVSMVLEVNKGIIKELNIKLGMCVKPTNELDIHKTGVIQFKKGGVFQKVGDVVYEVKEDDIKLDKTKLQVLNEKGEVTANIEGGARIFSREHTKEIIHKVKNKTDQEIGKLVVKILDTHNNQKQDYVEK
jgi:uncharacterized membrane protein (UPF0127 family)